MATRRTRKAGSNPVPFGYAKVHTIRQSGSSIMESEKIVRDPGVGFARLVLYRLAGI